jgi:protein TonB
MLVESTWSGRRPSMFESTLEAQSLNDGERRLGPLSAAALAHLVFGAVLLAVTAAIVPPFKGPEPPPPPVFIVLPPRLDDLAARPDRPPAPKKGTTDPATPKRAPARPAVPEEPPVSTPEELPASETSEALEGPTNPGEGAPGGPNGSVNGVLGGTGDADAGPNAGSVGDPVEITADMVRPVLLVKVDPTYPPVARRAGLAGRVTLRAVVSVDGTVESVEVRDSTNPLFNDAAVDAVRQWRYRPALMGGRPVRVIFSVTVQFLIR